MLEAWSPLVSTTDLDPMKLIAVLQVMELADDHSLASHPLPPTLAAELCIMDPSLNPDTVSD